MIESHERELKAWLDTNGYRPRLNADGPDPDVVAIADAVGTRLSLVEADVAAIKIRDAKEAAAFAAANAAPVKPVVEPAKP
jgi:hypothetical protein